jgi:hypothetical protein
MQGTTLVDVFYGCLGVAAIILALGAVSSIPSVLGLIERITLHDPRANRSGPPSGPTDSPWGRRHES